MKNTFKSYASHNDVDCFYCGASIGKTEKPIFYGFPRGAYGLYCSDCKMRTFYDTEDTSIKFDRIGNHIPATCE